jgi:hypothetical protein
MRLTPLESDVFNDLKHYKVNFENSTPLRFYILKEAEVQQMGIRLGEVGARIVTEVFIGLLEGATHPSFLKILFVNQYCPAANHTATTNILPLLILRV